MVLGEKMRQRSLHALLAVTALLLQLLLPGLHAPHSASHAPDERHPSATIAGHDAFDCPFCAALAHGRAGALSPVPTIVVVAIFSTTVAAPSAPLLAAPALDSAAPRGPPALA